MAPKRVKLRNIHWMFISVLIVSAMFSASSIRTVSAVDTTLVYVDPPQVTFTTATVGQSFKVNVTIANVTNLAGVEFTMTWNASLLSCFEITEYLFHAVTPQAEYENIWSIKLTKNNTGGYATYAQTYQDLQRAIDEGYAPINITTAEYPQGKLALAILTFNITQVPAANTFNECNLTLSPVKLGDPTPAPISSTVTNGHYMVYGPPEIITTTVPYLGTNYAVTTTTNASLVTDSVNFVKLNATSYKLEFNLTGIDGAAAYVNVTIPKALMSIGPSDQWMVEVNSESKTPIVTSDATNWYLYITTSLSTKQVEIWGTVPEFTVLLIPLLMAATLVAVGLRRRKRL
jgi:hypothetical protein